MHLTQHRRHKKLLAGNFWAKTDGPPLQKKSCVSGQRNKMNVSVDLVHLALATGRVGELIAPPVHIAPDFPGIAPT